MLSVVLSVFMLYTVNLGRVLSLLVLYLDTLTRLVSLHISQDYELAGTKLHLLLTQLKDTKRQLCLPICRSSTARRQLGVQGVWSQVFLLAATHLIFYRQS